MSATQRLGLLFLVVFAFVLGSTLAPGQVEKGPAVQAGVQKWEHKAFSAMTDEAGNPWGDEGWELVAVTAPTDRGGTRWYYFKRPKP